MATELAENPERRTMSAEKIPPVPVDSRQPIMFPDTTSANAANNEIVVLLHGLGGSPAFMSPLEKALLRHGYATSNWGYASIRGEIQALSQRLHGELQRLENDQSVSRFHLVAHSMGSIVVRALLAEEQFSRLSRLVMLGPPHRGSLAANMLGRFLGRLCQPLAQLSDDPGSFVNRLPEPVGYEIGIIAASRDRVVRVENTHLEVQSDHTIVDAGHTTMLFRDEVAGQVINFLQAGQFSRGTNAKAVAAV